jgi:hypothetical protein
MARFASSFRLVAALISSSNNLLNHSHFVGGYLSDVSAFSTAAISRNLLVPGNSSFGQINNFFASNSRSVQLVGRIVF